MATIGRNEAVAELPLGIRLWGCVGWLAWLGLHLLQLMGFRNRANVLVNWAWNYVTYDRGAAPAGRSRPRATRDPFRARPSPARPVVEEAGAGRPRRSRSMP